MSEQKQLSEEMLSAFIDSEQSDAEMIQTIDALLKDDSYRECYANSQFIHDVMREQTYPDLLDSRLRKNIAMAVDELPAHFVEQAVTLQELKSTNTGTLGQFLNILDRHFFSNKMLSGFSVAATVMLVTLFSLQSLNTINDAGDTTASANQLVSNTPEPAVSLQEPVVASGLVPLNRPVPNLPVTLASGNSEKSLNTNTIKQQYQWIEADPLLSKQIRQYISEHEVHRAAYNLQPEIRTATYQINE